MSQETQIPVYEDVRPDDIEGHTHTLTTIPVGQIIIDQTYQRRVNEKHVDRIASNFDPRLLQPVTLHERPNHTLVCVDGQHRVLGTRRSQGVQYEIPATVYTGLSPAEEAWLFVNLNTTSRKVESRAVFWALFAAEDPTVRAIVDICNDLGIRISQESEEAKPRPMVVHATNTLRVLAGSGGYRGTAFRDSSSVVNTKRLAQLRLVLETLVLSWPNDDKTFTSTVINGMNSFLTQFEGMFNYERLVDRLEQEGLVAVLQRANGANLMLGHGRPTGVTFAIVEAYNKYLRTGRLVMAG